MILTLHLAAEAGSPDEVRTLEYGTMTIGRGTENTWMLGDPDRTISKQHCRIDRSEDSFLLTDTSTNGVFLNADIQPLGRGHSHMLVSGDVIIVGPFRITAALEEAPTAMPQAEPPPMLDLSQPQPYSGTVETPGSPVVPPGEDPWLHAIPGGKFGPGLRAGPQGWEAPPDPADYAATGLRTEPTPLDAGPLEYGHASEHGAATTAVMRLPTAQAVLPMDWNDVDPLEGAELAELPVDRVLNKPNGAVTQQDVLLPMHEPREAWNLVPPAPTLAPPSTAPIPFPAPPPVLPPVTVATPLLPEAEDEGWDAEPDPAPLAPPALAMVPPAPPMVVTAPPLPAALPQAPARPVVEAMPGYDADPQGARLVAAFLAGAGLPQEALAGLALETSFQQMGEMVRAAVEGVREILATRAMVKSELRADHTVIQAADNNAMKFAPDVQRCLAAMVGQPPAGFLPGPEAMRRSMEDIKRHELALVAALNNVFSEMTTQLDPEAIGTAMRGETGISSMIPYAREARCWTLYTERYAALQGSGSAENTGGSLLAPVATAYAKHLRRGV